MTDEKDKNKDSQQLSADDLRLLEALMKDVTPYKGKKISVPKEAETAGSIEKPFTVIPKIERPKKREVKATSQGLDKRTDERLRRGQMPIEARLDMHGMTQDQGRVALEKFIVSAYERGLRCVLVITGRGKAKSSEEDWLAPKPGILKQRVPEWMEEEPIKQLILKTHPARYHDGGEGAMYVLIRRNRD